MNINFNKIYLTKKFSIIKLIDKNNLNVNELSILINELTALEEKKKQKKDVYEKKLKTFQDLNNHFNNLRNEQFILKNDLEEIKRKLDILKDLNIKHNNNIGGEKSFITYQSLLFNQYVSFLLVEEIKKEIT